MPLTIEEQIVLQYAIPHSNQQGNQWWWKAKDKRRVNWKRTMELALFHDVFPSVYCHLKEMDWPMVPGETVKKFQETWQHHLARSIVLTDELDRILDLFAKEGVRVVPLKGAVLARLLYPDINIRAFNDLDIWVRPVDRENACELLQKAGYEQQLPVDQRYLVENEYSISVYRRLFRGSRICIDLHWGLAKPRDYEAIPEESWWQHAVWIHDQKYCSLAPDDMLIYLTIKVHVSTYSYLKQFVDIYQLITQWENRLDWEYIRQTAQEIGMFDNLIFVLLTTKCLFGMQTTELHLEQWLSLRLRSLRLRLLGYIFTRQTIVHGRYGRDLRQGLCLFLNDRLSRSIASGVEVLFSPRKVIAARYCLPPHSKKVYFYCCLNPFLITYCLLRGLVVKASDKDGLSTMP